MVGECDGRKRIALAETARCALDEADNAAGCRRVKIVLQSEHRRLQAANKVILVRRIAAEHDEAVE